ncbi:hypothetical protein OYC64_012783 [Pagothenia borchgrevinki]|uniref:BAR domain-containing protein n=1 Tax=Pagothenia borchgrevinki TaxID=8213 RepID=A0ABD2FS54_PAGBO
MSVSGMKKQLHKASQLLNERLMGAEGTKMDDDFLKMEKSVAVLQSLLLELLCRTTEVLQPNPADRAKLSVLNTMSRIRGQGKAGGVPADREHSGRFYDALRPGARSGVGVRGRSARGGGGSA